MIIIGCNQGSAPPTGGNGGGIELFEFLVEKDICLSPDGEYIYYYGEDTALPQWTGIYRAKISNPFRELMVNIDGISSPSASKSGDYIYYIKDNGINKVSVAEETITSLPVLSGREIHRVIILNDSLMAAWADSSIFLINTETLETDSLNRGGYPSLLPCDSFIYLTSGPGGDVSILKSSFTFNTGDTLYTTGYHADIAWPAYDCANENIVYTVPAGNGWHYVYLKEIDQPGLFPQLIDSTTHPRILKFSELHIIYTAPDGKLNRATESGSKSRFTHRPEELEEPPGK